MRIVALAVVLLIGGALPGNSQTRIDSISTNFRWLGPNDKIVVERYDDPKVTNVSCYMSRADTGGIKGGLGLAEDPSRFSIACRAVGPVAIPEIRGDRLLVGLTVLQDVRDSSGCGHRKECVGLHGGKHKAHQWLALQ
jgi:CreA protein